MVYPFCQKRLRAFMPKINICWRIWRMIHLKHSIVQVTSSINSASNDNIKEEQIFSTLDKKNHVGS